MPPSSSTKKVAKAAKGGGSRSAGSGRSLGFPLGIAAVLIAGLVVVGAGHQRRAGADRTAPQPGDHWHAPYGIFICDEFRPFLNDLRGDERGVHTHDDGVIHIHPFSGEAVGKKSVIDNFFREVKLEVTDSSIRFPGGEDAETWENGDECPDGKPGRVVLLRWEDIRAEDAVPAEITEDIVKSRFDKDGLGFVIAFAPEGTDIGKPSSVATLDNLSDVDNPNFTPDGLPVGPAPSIVTGGTGTTTVGGDTATTAAGGTATTKAVATATTTPATTTETTGA